MKSTTKNKQDGQTINRMVMKFFPSEKMEDYVELTEGYFNVAYEVSLSSGRHVILKISPSPEMRVMTYEKNIMYSEVEAMKMAGKSGGIPVPEVLGYDGSCTVCGSPYFFMEKLDGKSLNVVKDMLPPDRLKEIKIEGGRINKRINEISCPCFGYPEQAEFQGNEWYPVFERMLKAGIRDAENGNVDLKIPTDKLWELLKRDSDIFAEVTEPKLVHWDCWDGNIFVKDGRITGIIDWERSIWGDPLMEVGFRTYSDTASFLEGYGMPALTENQKRRALWYDIYLLILVSLECEYRKYDTMDMYEWSTGLLKEQFERLRKEDEV